MYCKFGQIFVAISYKILLYFVTKFCWNFLQIFFVIAFKILLQN